MSDIPSTDPEPAQEAPPMAQTQTADEQVFYPIGGPVTDPSMSVDEAVAQLEEAERRYFYGTRQGTEEHYAAKQTLDEAQANVTAARKARRYGHGAQQGA